MRCQSGARARNTSRYCLPERCWLSAKLLCRAKSGARQRLLRGAAAMFPPHMHSRYVPAPQSMSTRSTPKVGRVEMAATPARIKCSAQTSCHPRRPPDGDASTIHTPRVGNKGLEGSHSFQQRRALVLPLAYHGLRPACSCWNRSVIFEPVAASRRMSNRCASSHGGRCG